MTDNQKDQQEKILDGLYRSREILMNKVDKKSGQIKQIYTRAILFFVAFSALIFFRDFKPSYWETASGLFAKWEQTYDKGYLANVSYRDFLASQDSVIRTKRQHILEAMDSSASGDLPMLTYYNQAKKGFYLDSLPVIQKQIEDLLAYQSEIERDSLELKKLKVNDTLQKIDSVLKRIVEKKKSDTVAENQKKHKKALQKIQGQQEQIATRLKGLQYDVRLKDSLSKAQLKQLSKQYPTIKIWADETKSIKTQIDFIQKQFNVLKNDPTITPWLTIDKKSLAWQWKYKTWEILNTNIFTKKSAAKNDTIRIIADWQAIFKPLRTVDQNAINQNIIKPDSLFDFNKQEVKKYINTEKSKQEKLKVPTAKISSTKIPLPLKHILLILPLLYAGFLVIIQLINLKRSSYEIRTTIVENRIKDHLGGEDLVRANVFGDEIIDGKDNWSYIRKMQFTLLFKNNPTYYKDAFFVLVSFFIFMYLMYKWTLLLQYNPGLLSWGIGIAALSSILYVIVYIVNRKVGKKTLQKEREKADQEFLP